MRKKLDETLANEARLQAEKSRIEKQLADNAKAAQSTMEKMLADQRLSLNAQLEKARKELLHM